MSGPIPRVFTSDARGEGGSYLSLEQFFNELSVLLLNSSTAKALSVAVVDGSGVQITSFGGANTATTPTLANVGDEIISTTLLALNTGRKGAIIFNDSSAILYVKFGLTASTSSFTYKVNPFQTLEMLSGVIYTGIITGIWASDAGGSARTTELTA